MFANNALAAALVPKITSRPALTLFPMIAWPWVLVFPLIVLPGWLELCIV
jgi:hypothetical protein